MNILVIGSGGREHAVCQAFARSTRVGRVYCASGNAGIAEIAECVPIKHDEIDRLADFASQNAIDLTFAGGETPLALGVVDEFEARGLKIIGPGKRASELESSKAFAKDFMARWSVPTAAYFNAATTDAAIAELESGRFGGADAAVVVKADGLAAGKGVVVASNREEAIAAINDMSDLVGSDAASKIVLEECLFGKEVSLLMFANGEDFALMPPTRDHKRIGEGDTGPNTGGMGTITDASLLASEELDEIIENIVRPTLRGCVREGFPFRGILFLGLMMTACGSPRVSKGETSDTVSIALADAQASANIRVPKLLEYNVRFGDPEAQAILVRLESDLVDICEAMLGCQSPRVSNGDTSNMASIELAHTRASASLAELNIKWKRGSSACVVLASQGYPSAPRTGDMIVGLDEAERVPKVSVFHAGTSMLVPGEYYTAGGRVLGITATGDNLDTALATAYETVGKISFDGIQFRRDIGK